LELTTDIIVGFPGETEEDFQDTLELVKKVGFSAAFTFMYSPRTGTKAAEMEDQVPDDGKKERLLRLNALQEKNTQATNERYIGKTDEVLVEGADNRQSGVLFGKLSCFKMVYFPGTPDKIGQYIRVRITGVTKNSLNGIIEVGEENV
jgi:tRNA-2-methylthio-N6-dimethylallyladenosine synthase